MFFIRIALFRISLLAKEVKILLILSFTDTSWSSRTLTTCKLFHPHQNSLRTRFGV